MNDVLSPQPPSESRAVQDGRPRRWEALGVIVASLVGLLALLVSGYTAWIQRQQVRAEVWPRLVVGANGLEHSLVAINKGTGPAIVRSPQVFVDGTPQPDWDHVMKTLGLQARGYNVSTIAHNVLASGEELSMLQFTDASQWEAFGAAGQRVTMDICFCSTLGDCWMYSDRRTKNDDRQPLVVSIDACPRLAPEVTFNN